ncbi:MAG TPA: hypothetical protein VIJ16_03640 [Gemmatimonadaceae bacterium]
MPEFPAAMPHGPIKEVFPDVFFVTGTMKNEFFGSMWHFSRNMTIVREGDRLTLINSVRLSPKGLAELDRLGRVVNVVRIGDMHGMDDAFYVDHYKATYWALPSMSAETQPPVNKTLVPGGEMPISDASLFSFTTTTRPEGILRLDREGGIMIACDSLQNWVGPDEFFDEPTIETMRKMNFFTEAGIGLAWIHGSEPKPDDFVRLKQVPFRHALCGHGEPCVGQAQQGYHAAFKRFFEV